MINSVITHTPFEALLDAAVDGIIVIDAKGSIEIINRATEALFGYKKDELIGQNISQLMPSPDREQHDHYLEAYLNTGTRKMIGIGRKTQGQKKDNSCFPMYLSVGQIDETQRTCFVGIIRDLTDQKQQDQAIKQSQQEIRQLHERLTHVARISTMGEMATGIAHEINQPLTAIATYAQACQRMLLAGSSDSSELLNALNKIDDQAQRASKVITGIRQLSKKQAMVCADYNCHGLINEVVNLAETYAHEKGISLQLDLTKVSATQKIRVDNIQTQQVLLNLINNAIESMVDDDTSLQAPFEPSKSVIVRANLLSDTMLEVAIIDQGHGIKAKDKDQLFDAFFTTKPLGLGMGLSICQSIITTQGGQINYKKNDKKGSTFTITLPISIGVGA